MLDCNLGHMAKAPIAKSTPAQGPVDLASEGPTPIRIVMIEDDAVTRDSLAFRLRAEGFEVEAFELAQDGVRFAVAEGCDLIVLDLMLPDMHGHEALRALRAQGCAAPVLILSGQDAPHDRATGLGLGADRHLTKPASYETVADAVYALLARPAAGGMRQVATVGALRLRLRDEVAVFDGARLPLDRAAYKALELLALRAGRVVPLDVLRAHVAAHEAPAQVEGAPAIETVLDDLVRRLRRTVDDAPYLRRGRDGYRLAIPMVDVQAPAVGAANRSGGAPVRDIVFSLS